MIWIDAQLPPSIAPWIEENFNEPCKAVRDIGLRNAADFDIFQKGKAANVIVMTKDKDFVELLYVHKSPPKVIWLTCGNTSKTTLKELLTLNLRQALRILEAGNDLVEIQ
jgi:predicted nuclease of predicted toxin-antitoxin system